VQVVVDVHERRSDIAGALRTLGISVDERSLPVGDYDVGGGALIERKTVADLHRTVTDGRFWPQVGRIRRSARWAYLLVEGTSLYDGPVAEEAIRGLLLAVSDLGVTIVRSADTIDSARWIRRVAIRRTEVPHRDRPTYAQRPQRDPRVSPAEQALAAAPGVSVETARALLERFGNLRDVLLASREELASVHGVGPHRARAIASLGTNL